MQAVLKSLSKYSDLIAAASSCSWW